jgi:hypothetical protein
MLQALIRSSSQSGSDLRAVRQASKTLSRIDIEPMLVLQSVLAFLGTNLENYRWPYPERPLAMTEDEIMAINLFALDLLQTMLDRAGVQNLAQICKLFFVQFWV